jgi:hypothetical protein
MYSIVKSFIKKEPFGSLVPFGTSVIDPYLSNAFAWLEERYGELNKWAKHRKNWEIQYINVDGFELIQISDWESFRKMLFSETNVTLDFDLLGIHKSWNDRVCIYETERIEYISEHRFDIMASYKVYHSDVIVVVEDELTALEFKLAVG